MQIILRGDQYAVTWDESLFLKGTSIGKAIYKRMNKVKRRKGWVPKKLQIENETEIIHKKKRKKELSTFIKEMMDIEEFKLVVNAL